MSNIFELLKKDHELHRKLLKQLAETHGDSEERRTLFKQFSEEVTAHAAAEEESLYAEMLARPELQDEGRHSVAEHKEIADYLSELSEMDMSSPGWLVKFKDMRHRYEHHIDEEEEDMFPAADSEFGKAVEDRLGEKYSDRKPKELEKAEEGIEHDERD